MRSVITNSDCDNETVTAAAELIEGLAMKPRANEGFKFGNPHAPLKGVLVCWMCTLQAIQRAASEDCNMIICHENVHYPCATFEPGLEKYLTWTVSRQRIQALCQGEITVYRAHGMLDQYCILDDFAVEVGLGSPAVSEGFYCIYDIEPRTVAQLTERVKQVMAMDCVRVTGDLVRGGESRRPCPKPG